MNVGAYSVGTGFVYPDQNDVFTIDYGPNFRGEQAVVPVPPSMLLLGSGLLGLVGWRRTGRAKG